MQEGFVVDHFLFPADEQASKAMKPGVGALDNPAAGTDEFGVVVGDTSGDRLEILSTPELGKQKLLYPSGAAKK